MWKLVLVATVASLAKVQGASLKDLDGCYQGNEGGVFIAPCSSQVEAKPGQESECPWSYNTEAVSCASIDWIVQRHNELRRRVAVGGEAKGLSGPQPKATNMQKMVWSEDLRQLAAHVAVNCIHDSDTCHDAVDSADLDDIAADGGVNVFRAAGALDSVPVAWRKSIDTWFGEVAKFNASGVDSFVDNPQTSNYTRMMWADSSEIGCVSVVAGEGPQSGPQSGTQSAPQRRTLVCAYGPHGNVEDEPVYKKGVPCSGCLKNCFNGGLCDFH